MHSNWLTATQTLAVWVGVSFALSALLAKTAKGLGAWGRGAVLPLVGVYGMVLWAAVGVFRSLPAFSAVHTFAGGLSTFGVAFGGVLSIIAGTAFFMGGLFCTSPDITSEGGAVVFRKDSLVGKLLFLYVGMPADRPWTLCGLSWAAAAILLIGVPVGAAAYLLYLVGLNLGILVLALLLGGSPMNNWRHQNFGDVDFGLVHGVPISPVLWFCGVYGVWMAVALRGASIGLWLLPLAACVTGLLIIANTVHGVALLNQWASEYAADTGDYCPRPGDIRAWLAGRKRPRRGPSAWEVLFTVFTDSLADVVNLVTLMVLTLKKKVCPRVIIR